MDDAYAGGFDADKSIAIGIIRAAKAIRAQLAIRLAVLGLAVGDDEVLMSMTRHQPTSRRQLATTLGLRAATLTRSMDRLIGRGLVETISETLICLTSAGDDARSSVIDIFAAIDAQMTGNKLVPTHELIMSQLVCVDRRMRGGLTDLR